MEEKVEAMVVMRVEVEKEAAIDMAEVEAVDFCHFHTVHCFQHFNSLSVYLSLSLKILHSSSQIITYNLYIIRM